ncbi:solute carrier family 23 member 1-like isoform X2 [Phacochoerus africanus]|uniref:solute carrier family 23 member 1-like isoform X2 n=1 Tax=Phacochoerus africanus TaxID=41426 RepID=UPI001FD8A442|nr:solute carrier family 23 member 1-like isoform X2 [Phacochoerus africanus]
MNSAIASPEHPDPSWRGDGVFSSQEGSQDKKKDDQPRSPSSSHLAYSILDIPPWYLCIFLGIQHFLTALGALVAVPFILAKDLCLQHDPLTQSYLLSTIFFVSGICTLLQVFLGVRLPILQGGTFAFVAPSLAMLSLPTWKCPAWTLNASLVNTSSPEFTEEWQKRIRELQGAILVASCVQMLVGFSGLIGFLMRFIGPLTIAPTIALMALPLFDSAGNDAGIHWGIAATTIFLIVLFSQYLKNIAVPVPVYGREKKCHTSKFYLFQVLLALCLSWLLCFVLTITNALPSAPTAYGYLARTDTKGNVLSQAPWFRVPYPGQWGLPTISLAGVFGIIAGVISSMVESVGDYYACARLVGAPPPPRHAINRGIGIEGLGCLLAGAWGTGNGTTSYSENVGALSITRVGSRMVIVAAGCVLLLMGIFGKIGAAFATIPTPVIGGMFLVMFGVITAVGISNLQALMGPGCPGGLSPAVRGHELIQKPLCLWLLHLLWACCSQLGEQEPREAPHRDSPTGPGHPGAADHRHVCWWISGFSTGQHHPWKPGGERPPGMESHPGGIRGDCEGLGDLRPPLWDWHQVLHVRLHPGPPLLAQAGMRGAKRGGSEPAHALLPGLLSRAAEGRRRNRDVRTLLPHGPLASPSQRGRADLPLRSGWYPPSHTGATG